MAEHEGEHCWHVMASDVVCCGCVHAEYRAMQRTERVSLPWCGICDRGGHTTDDHKSGSATGRAFNSAETGAGDV